jgi:transcriptional regulator with XRE-family HTH domain
VPTSFPNLLEANVKHRRQKVGRRLADARRAAQLPQEAVAAALDYQQAEVSRIEKGKRAIDVVELENFALLYGKSLEHFATWGSQQDEDKAALKNEQLDDNVFVTRA